MSTALVIILIVLAVLVALAVGGSIAQQRRLARTRPAFDASLEEVNAELAAAHAQDRGWERTALVATARDLYGRERPGTTTEDLTLAGIVDRPGTDDDKALFRVRAADGRAETLTLGRRDGAWVLESLE